MAVLQWSKIGVHWYAFSGIHGFHIAKGGERGSYFLSIYIHNPELVHVHRKLGLPNVDEAKEAARIWIKETGFVITEVEIKRRE